MLTPRNVDIFGAGKTFIDQRNRFAHHGMLDAFREEARHVALDPHWLLSHRAHDRADRLSDRFIRVFAADHFDRRNQVRRHEKVQAQHTRAGGARFTDPTDRETGRIAHHPAPFLASVRMLPDWVPRFVHSSRRRLWRLKDADSIDVLTCIALVD
jgi:hypothetical protein